MPLYPYRCTKCGYRFEKIQKFNSKPERECPKCHGALERTITAPALRFKGAGWYVNDYAGKNAAPTAETAPAPAQAPAVASDSSAAAPAAAPAVAPATATS